MEMRDPAARNGKMWASRAAAGRNGRALDGAAVGKLGSYAGDAARLFVNGASVVTKCPVAPVSRIAGDFGGEEA